MILFDKLHKKHLCSLKKQPINSQDISEEQIRAKLKTMSWIAKHKTYLQKGYDPQDSDMSESLGLTFNKDILQLW